jgi:hypothetical protein
LEKEHCGEYLAVWGPQVLPRLGLAERVQLCEQIARRLVPAHDAAIPHGALTPQHVLVAPGPRAWQVKLLAGTGPGPLDLSDMIRHGTGLLYLPGEIRGNPGAAASLRADRFALGVLFLQVLAANFQLSVEPGAEDLLPDERLRRYIRLADHFDASRRATVKQLAEWLACWPADAPLQDRRPTGI